MSHSAMLPKLMGILMAVTCHAALLPEQIHLTLTGRPGEMAVTWNTMSTNATTAFVKFGVHKNSLSTVVKGSGFLFGTGGHNFTVHTAIMFGLEPNTVYYYVVGGDSGYSHIQNFTSQPVRAAGAMFAVYADFGMANDVSLAQLVHEASAGVFDYVLHVGDFAYDLDTDAGYNGDKFMRSIQPIAAHVPYMVAPGNHEAGNNFTHYIHRFAGTSIAGANSGSNTNLYYSFDIDNVHFVAIDTEVYAYSRNQGEIDSQLKWLENDLIMANNNRAQSPWIVMYGHKGYYMDKTNYTGFEELAHRYGVDLYLCGHVHNYQRLLPVYKGEVDSSCSNAAGNVYTNPKYMVTMVVGSPGCREDISFELPPNPQATLSTYSYSYGYAHMQFVNATHMHWTWEQTSTMDFKPIDTEAAYRDDFWLVQSKHGPRMN